MRMKRMRTSDSNNNNDKNNNNNNNNDNSNSVDSKTTRLRDKYAELGQGMRMMRDKETQDKDGGQGR